MLSVTSPGEDGLSAAGGQIRACMLKARARVDDYQTCDVAEARTAGVSTGQHYTCDTVVHNAYTDLPLWTILMLT